MSRTYALFLALCALGCAPQIAKILAPPMSSLPGYWKQRQQKRVWCVSLNSLAEIYLHYLIKKFLGTNCYICSMLAVPVTVLVTVRLKVGLGRSGSECDTQHSLVCLVYSGPLVNVYNFGVRKIRKSHTVSPPMHQNSPSSHQRSKNLPVPSSLSVVGELTPLHPRPYGTLPLGLLWSDLAWPL